MSNFAETNKICNNYIMRSYIFFFQSYKNKKELLKIMLHNVDKIFILGLLKNKTRIISKFDSIFNDKSFDGKLEYYLVNGVGSATNDGLYDSSLWSILQHKTMDRISRDIFKNHVDIYKKSKQMDYERVMILEDDAIFTSYKNQNQLNFLNSYIRNNENYDIFYLGYVNWPILWSSFSNPFVIKPFSPLTAHAYIINRNGIQKILEMIQTNPELQSIHIDKLLATSKTIKKKAAFPMISFQEKDPSLYLKACDKIGIYIDFIKFSRINENISIYLPILFYCFLFLIFTKNIIK